MTVTVRPAHTAELPAVGDLCVSAYLADGALADGDSYAPALRDAVTRAREVYVAELDGCLVGTVTFCPEGSPWCEVARPGEGEFRMLAVDPAARRRGVAAALVGLCVERSRELGYRAVVLCTLPAQRGAHRLYEGLGFRRAPELDWTPHEGVDLLGFRLELDPPAGVPGSSS
jgi:ribosomal protein S18 acetylase RimI-like enzyme